MKIINVVGARPNFMKIAPLMDVMQQSRVIDPVLLHTGQHYDEKMSKLFFEDLAIPEPDIYLDVGSDTHARQVAAIMPRFEDVCDELKPDAVLVVGDVNSTIAAGLVAVKKGIKLVHVEAGLRSRDRTMPEEINRLVTDAIADILFTPSRDADENLLKENVPPEKIFFVGNIMIDTLYRFKPVCEQSTIMTELGVHEQDYILVTLHRPSNVDSREQLDIILSAFEHIQEDITILFPVHPRTSKMISQFGFDGRVAAMPNARFIEPLGYIDFQKLMMHARAVITDSGGIQEETTVLDIPCLTVRDNTERPITVTQGTNELIRLGSDSLYEQVSRILSGDWKKGSVPELWDGNTSSRIIDVLETRITV